MLVLSRKEGERILIGDSITLVVVEIRHDKVRLGIEAPRSVVVNREEVAGLPPRRVDCPSCGSKVAILYEADLPVALRKLFPPGESWYVVHGDCEMSRQPFVAEPAAVT